MRKFCHKFASRMRLMRCSFAHDSTTNTFESNCRNQYSSIAAVAEGTQLVASVSYDLDGNMTRHGEWTYAYDSGNRLVSVASNGITVVSMSYDTQGRRVKKVAADGTHRYFYDGWLLVYENVVRPNNTTNEIEYVWGKDISGTRDGAAGIGGLLYLKRDGVIYVPCYDAYGNILGYRDTQGNVVASYTYDAFGNIIGQSSTMADAFSFRFSTKYFDADCDLYYYGYRFYHPVLMRWLNRDPIEEEDGANLYLYCKNSTLLIYDLFGLKANCHHLLPRQFEHKFVTAGIDIDAAEYGVVLEALDHTGQGGLHPSWNREWGSFFEKHPKATKSQILAQLEKMKKSPQYSSVLSKGVKAKLSYVAWRKSADQARKAATKVAARSLAKRGLAQGAKKVVKRVPIVGLVFVYTDIRDKGFVRGACNSLLDACPFVGWGKLGVECIWGDWFPDNEEHRNE